MKNWTCLWYFSIGYCLGIAQGQVDPSNIVALIGGSATLPCSAPSSSTFLWYFTPNGGNQSTLIIINCASNPPYGTSSNSTSCSLVISNVVYSLAGLYQCTYGTVSSAAYLIVIDDSGPQCSETRTGTSNDYTLDCVLGYSGQFAPVASWYNDTGKIQYSASSNSTYTSASASVTVPPGESELFNCTVEFETPTNLPVIPGVTVATNAPSYFSSCQQNVSGSNQNNKSGEPGWIAGIVIFSLGTVGNIVVISLYVAGEINRTVVCTQGCGRMCVGCGRKGLYISMSVSAVIIIAGSVVGGLIIGNVIHVANKYKGVQGLIGGFTITLGLLLGTTTTVLFYAFGCTDAGCKKGIKPA